MNRGLVFCLLITGALIISGCTGTSHDNTNNYPQLSPEPLYDSNINEGRVATVAPPSVEKTVPKRVCDNLKDEDWKISCLAYEETNPEYCKALDKLGLSYYSSNNCYYDLAVNWGLDTCSEIDDVTYKWQCMAISKKDYTQCYYMPTLESEISCLNYFNSIYKEENVCDVIGSKESELIEKGFVQGSPAIYGDGKSYPKGGVALEKSKEYWYLFS